MIGKPTYSRIAAMAKRDISTVDKGIPIFLRYAHRWKAEELRNHLRYVLDEIDRISHPASSASPVRTCPDGARPQGLNGTMSALLVGISAVLAPYVSDLTWGRIWHPSEEDIGILCELLNDSPLCDEEDQVSADEVETAVESLELTFLSLGLSSLELQPVAGSKRPLSRESSGSEDACEEVIPSIEWE